MRVATIAACLLIASGATAAPRKSASQRAREERWEALKAQRAEEELAAQHAKWAAAEAAAENEAATRKAAARDAAWKAQREAEVARIASGVYDEDQPTIAATAYAAAFERNKIRADIAYKGREVTASGKITGFGEDLFGSPFVVLDDCLTCYFDEAWASQLAKLEKRQAIEITGKSAGAGNVLKPLALTDCRLQD